MKNFMFKHAIKIFLSLLLPVLVLHICILLKIFPYTIAWGGRLENDIEMYVFETLSILINLFLCWILLMKGGFVPYQFSDLVLNRILWTFFGLFVLNTLGNIVAKTSFEKLFAILTGLSAMLIWIILRQKKTSQGVGK